MNKIEKIREEISGVDNKIAKLFNERLNLSKDIAKAKQEGNISIADYKREEIVENNFTSNVSEEFKGHASSLSRTLMAISKIVQRVQLYKESEKALLPPAQIIDIDVPIVAYQGIEGAYSYVAAKKFFKNSKLCNFEYFEDVFKNVSDGRANYGILPIENSKSGAIGEVYDLLSHYGCYIVRQTWCEVNHCLMANENATLKSIRKVFSHPEGFKQCGKFLQKCNFDLIATTNTAVAAKEASLDTTNSIAAIASPEAAEIHNLKILNENISTDNSNKTRFIVISKNPFYNEKCDHISITFKTLDKSGALCDVLFQFMAHKVNLSRIESRPSKNGEYSFFADLQGNINDTMIQDAITCAKGSCAYLEILGCYNEV